MPFSIRRARYGVWVFERERVGFDRQTGDFMSAKRRQSNARAALFSMDGAQIREMQERFERERDEWHARKPALEREAARLGKRLVMICEQSALAPNGEAEGMTPIIFEQTLGYSFERIEAVPKLERATCGARTRSGKPCCARVVTRPNGTLARRCRLHGGLSSGPKTQAGRDAIGEANRARAKLT